MQLSGKRIPSAATGLYSKGGDIARLPKGMPEGDWQTPADKPYPTTDTPADYGRRVGNCAGPTSANIGLVAPTGAGIGRSVARPPALGANVRKKADESNLHPNIDCAAPGLKFRTPPPNQEGHEPRQRTPTAICGRAVCNALPNDGLGSKLSPPRAAHTRAAHRGQLPQSTGNPVFRTPSG